MMNITNPISKFYIIATPIGDYQDITFRAAEALKSVDFIVCEHEREYQKLCSMLHIPQKKYIVSDRKREQSAIPMILDCLRKGETGGLVSDCGTPLFEDPGYRVLDAIRRENDKTPKKPLAEIISLPGPNSIITAMTLAPFEIKQFYFAGFITRDNDKRGAELGRLLQRRETVIFMESPYRLQNTLELLKKFAGKRNVFIPFDLTLPTRKLYYGKPDKVAAAIAADGIDKGEFIVFVE
ncbi:MAG: hypothetical protein J6W76_00395 [Spirochaetales bacterium]|nr:hypothetical protein [Spirochaetales bacterium]